MGRLYWESIGCYGDFVAEPISGFPNTEQFINYECSDKVGWDDIVFNGIFYNYDFFRGHKEKIKGWFEFEKLPPLTDDILVVHVRLGDYINNKYSFIRMLNVHMDEYKKVIKEANAEEVHVVTDEPDYPGLKELGADKVISESAMHDFAYIASAKRLLISRSSYSWWAAWLGVATQIYFFAGHFQFDGLWVNDEERYEKRCICR